MARRSPVRLLVSRALYVLAVVSLMFGVVTGVSWFQDRQRLREAAVAATASARTEGEKVTALLGWVYGNQGFAKNRHYFLWKKLDATPIQVMEHGGDCEDKSKLFATMLREIGVKSSLALLYPCENCDPTHVVTLVKTASGETPMDAVYNVTFPDGRGGFLDVAALKQNASIMPQRLDTLVAERGADDKIALYKRQTEGYDLVTTLNWDKNAATRAVAWAIRATGGEPWRMSRPLFLDDPKQFFMLLGLCAALGFGLLGWLLRRR